MPDGASTHDSLRAIEEMLSDIGAPSPSSIVAVTQGTRSVKKAKKVAAQKDCLSAENKGQWTVPKFETRTPSPASTISKGAPMAGKDRAEKRYYGNILSLPPRESPGPIYSPEMLLDQRTQGHTIPQAPRMPDDRHGSETPGPIYRVPTTIGRQVQSASSTAPSVSFTKGKRMNPRQLISRAHSRNSQSLDSPAPTAYQPDILNLSERGKSFSMSGAKTPLSKQFISRAHVVDALGSHSPGPIYCIYGDDVAGTAFKNIDSKHARAPAYSFGISDRPSAKEDVEEVPGEPMDPTEVCRVIPADQKGKFKRVCVNQNFSPGSVCKHIPQEKFISHEHSKVQCTTETPGPAYYTANFAPTEKESIGQSIARDRGNPKRFWSKELSSSKGIDSPGPRYFYNDDATRKTPAGAVLGSKTQQEDAGRDRFATNVFLGKGIGEAPGRHQSPGPIYNPKVEEHQGPAYTIVFKEKRFPKTIYPGPDRARFISKDLSVDNMGAHSPGPKYDVRTKEFGAEAPSYSFGISDRYFSEEINENIRDKLGTAEKPYTSPGEARFLSVALSRSARAGKTSPGPQNPRVNPNDETLSTTKRAPIVKICAPSSPARERTYETDVQPNMYYPRDDICLPEKRAHAFPMTERMPDLKNKGGPGPGEYKVKWKLVEKESNAVSFGGV